MNNGAEARHAKELIGHEPSRCVTPRLCSLRCWRASPAQAVQPVTRGFSALLFPFALGGVLGGGANGPRQGRGGEKYTQHPRHECACDCVVEGGGVVLSFLCAAIACNPRTPHARRAQGQGFDLHNRNDARRECTQKTHYEWTVCTMLRW
jgi:hypothetical protein